MKLVPNPKARGWSGPVPRKCDICGKAIEDCFVDGLMRGARGMWGIMCPECHYTFGVGLGTGRGQWYDRREGDIWVTTS